MQVASQDSPFLDATKSVEPKQEQQFFPCLPYGCVVCSFLFSLFSDLFSSIISWKSDFDMAGWQASNGQKRNGKISMVKDLEVKSYCAELTSEGFEKR